MNGLWQAKFMRTVRGCTPQAECSASEENHFRMDLGKYIITIPNGENLLLRGDLNGHVGKDHDVMQVIATATTGKESPNKKRKGFLNSHEHMAFYWLTPTSRK